MTQFRILTIDGGGIRGLFTLVLLERLRQAQPGFLDKVDFFAGTSTGMSSGVSTSRSSGSAHSA